MENSFYIDNKQVNYSFDDIETDNITIKSVPYNYQVNFISKKDLSAQIESIASANNHNHFVFIDQIVADLYENELFSGQDLFKLLAKEENKAFPAVMDLIDKLQAKNFSKGNEFLSVGGGITQDISAFVRSVFKRGINWTYVPTTLLAMGDSCIGAKSCLNYGGIKNQLGLFSSPRKVYICTEFLETLDQRDVLSGYGEILKLAIVGGTQCVDKFNQLVEQQNGDVLHNITSLIKLSLMVKKAVIELDEYENDIRKALNYGHTIGHAIEPLVNYEIPHGIAVSIGMVIENLIAVKYGTLPKADADRINNLIMMFIDKRSLNSLKNLPIETIIDNMKKDKKSTNNQISLAVPFKLSSFGILKIQPDEAFDQFLSAAINTIQK